MLIAPPAATGLALGAAGLVAGGLWILTYRPRPLRATPAPAPTTARRLPRVRRTAWRVLAATQGRLLPITPRELTALRWLLGAATGLLWVSAFGNPLAAAAYGAIAGQLPELAAQALARRQWDALDRAAYAFANVVRFRFQQGGTVLAAARALAPTADPPFRDWLTEALRTDTAGGRFERYLREQAVGLRHVELQLFADLLAVERNRGPAPASLDHLVSLWGERLQADAKRRGTIANTLRFGQAAIVAALGVLVLSVASSPAHAAVARTGLGLVLYGVAVGLVAASLWVSLRTARRAFMA
jgi:hypothetical protein